MRGSYYNYFISEFVVSFFAPQFLENWKETYCFMIKKCIAEAKILRILRNIIC